jgi:hypothetical protein
MCIRPSHPIIQFELHGGGVIPGTRVLSSGPRDLPCNPASQRDDWAGKTILGVPSVLKRWKTENRSNPLLVSQNGTDIEPPSPTNACNSNVRNILATSHLFPIFCPDRGRSPAANSNKVKDLPLEAKKCGGADALVRRLSQTFPSLQSPYCNESSPYPQPRGRSRQHRSP